VTLSQEYKVQKVAGREEVIKKLAHPNPTAGGLLTQVLSESAVRQAAQECFTTLPAGPVRPGATWTRKTQVDMSPMGSFQVTDRYIYEGRHGKLDRIKIETTWKDRPPEGNDPDRPTQTKTVDFKGTASGFVLFDRDRGRVVRMESTLKVTGKVILVTQDAEADLTLTQKTTLRTTDADPLAPAESPEDLKKEIERLREENRRLRKQLEVIREALQREGKPGY
jgi:hypothetical protein